MATEAKSEVRLEVSETYDAPVSRVYEAWAQSDQLKQWFGPGHCQVLEADFTPQVGSHYRITMDVGEEVATVHGQFTEVVAGEKLGFTWQWVGDDVNSHVTVAFSEQENGTKVTITHVGLENEESKEKHIMGWTASLAELRGLLPT